MQVGYKVRRSINLKVIKVLGVAIFAIASSAALHANTAANDAPLVQATDITTESDTKVQPYGANLFKSNLFAPSAANQNYKIEIGDKISLRIWGAAQYNEITEVDPEGNIFVPNVGPVYVKGVNASRLNALIKAKVASVYTQNVRVYAGVLKTNPLRVFVAGAVNNPGQYGGASQDSVLSYLSQAGGINNERGSYRNIKVKRHGVTVQQIDLYDFLERGDIPLNYFSDGDVVFVGPIGLSVSVQGAVKAPFKFEFQGGYTTGYQLIQLAKPDSKASHVAITGIRDGQPFYKYMTIEEFRSVQLQDGDQLSFEADLHAPVIGVQIEGAFKGPSFYALSNKANLYELLSRIEVDPEVADIKSVYIKRKSVAQQQKQMIESSIDRLQKMIMTAPVRSQGEATIRVKEAEIVNAYVKKLRSVKPEGRVLVSEQQSVQDVMLENEDVVVIPKKSDLIIVGGEVLSPTAVVYNPQLQIRDYVEKAGGFSDRADRKKIAILKRNGEIQLSKRTDHLIAGDQILILPSVEHKSLQFTKDLTQIIYQIALSAAVAIRNF